MTLRCFVKQKRKKDRAAIFDLWRIQLGGEAEGSTGGLEWSDPSFFTMLCSCCPSGDETFALGDGGLEG